MFEEYSALLTRRAFLTLAISSSLAKSLGLGDENGVSIHPPAALGVKPSELARLHRLCSDLRQWLEPQRTLLWAELPEVAGGQPKVMFWTPETPEEHAEADRFYLAATYSVWSTEEELDTELRRSSEWAVRIRLIGGRHLFVANNQGHDESGEYGLTPDAAAAAIMSPTLAKDLIVCFNEELSCKPGELMSFEPALPSCLDVDPRTALLRSEQR